MTERILVRQVKERTTALLLLLGILVFGISLSSEMGQYVKDGMILAVTAVIPTSLPFMVISDFYVCYGSPENILLLRRVFCALFGIGEAGISPFICGNIGGFPTGAKMCAECYERGTLTREDAERLLPLSINPSPAFVIGGVGMGLYRDIRIGFLMLISIYTATLLCGMITRTKRSILPLNTDNVNNSYDFIASVKSAGANSISIVSLISIFSGVLGVLKKRIENTPVLYIVFAFCEVTNAVKFCSVSDGLSGKIGMILSTFALGFGGISAGLQSAVFTARCGLRMRKYYLIKSIEGILAASVFSILYMI